MQKKDFFLCGLYKLIEREKLLMKILSLIFSTLLFAAKEAILGSITLVKADMTPKRIVNSLFAVE